MNWHVNTGTERPHHSALARGYTRKGKFITLSTTRDRVVEVFSMLRHDVLISSDGDNQLKRTIRGAQKRREILSQVSSYIDQAENFYNFARGSDYRSSALLYYYSFLNLAKAAVLMHSPEKIQKKFVHGVSPKRKTGELKNRSLKIEKVSVNQVSVFNELYLLIFGSYIKNNQTLTINSILGYLTDNRVEVMKLGGAQKNKIHQCRFYLLANNETKKAWIVLVTKQGFYPLNYPNTYKKFNAEFERFTPSGLNLFFTYEMSSYEDKDWNFSHSRKLFDIDKFGRYPVAEMYKYLEEVFGHNIEDDIYDIKASFLIVDPLNKNGKIKFNELMAIYVLMFYLSYIVRYSPNEFDTKFAQDSVDGWLIKNFVEAAPYTALTHLCALISGNKYRMLDR